MNRGEGSRLRLPERKISEMKMIEKRKNKEAENWQDNKKRE